MADTHTVEFENENRYRKYPFSRDASLVDSSGNVLGNDVFVDAVLYPENGLYSLTSIERGSDGVSTVVGLTTDKGGKASGVVDTDKMVVRVYDDAGLNRGVLVCGPGIVDVVENPSTRRFNAEICGACQFDLGCWSVSSVNCDGVALRGDVTFETQDGRTAVRAVSTSNDDGSSNVRFDVVPNTGIRGNANTGVRTIYIMRKPESFFDVLDDNGRPYLYIVNPSRYNAKIDRDKLCSYKNDASSDYKERSSGDDCGYGKKSTVDSVCFPSASDWDEFMQMHDPETHERKIGGKSLGYFYGYSGIPAANGFAAPTSMCLLFIEGTISVSFSIVQHVISANFHISNTDATNELFFYGNPLETDFSVIVKHDAYRPLFEFMQSNMQGKLGYVGQDEIRAVCQERGWLASSDDYAFPDDVDYDEYMTSLKNDLNDNGFARYRVVYVNRARDYFEHFDCLNWEVSSESVYGNEVRWLVGWGTGSELFAGGNAYSRFTVDGKTLTLPKWLVARYVWWKKYSKNGNQLRHFIVPKERGLVIYTGDYFHLGNPSNAKEWSPASWSCDRSLVTTMSTFERIIPGYMSVNWVSISDILRERMHKVYSADYDPTFGDTRFWLITSDMYDKTEFPEIPVDDLDDVASTYDNVVTSSTLVSQPSDAPLDTEDAADSMFYLNSWKGPLEYEYGKLYTPGIGYKPGSDSWMEAEAIKAPVVFKFDITDENSNSFDFITTDMTASGFVYKNPIHIEIVEGTTVPAKIDTSKVTDYTAIAEETYKLVGDQTQGNGIEISIPGLGG
jgi:hypothetical protein